VDGPDPSQETAPEPSQETAPEQPSGAARTFRIVRVVSVGIELPDQYPTLTLEEVETARRRLSFRIGVAEGVALSHVLGRTTAPRPLTHDLFGLVLQRFTIDVVAVRLVGRRGATYLAELELMGGHRREVLDCRPSDGIALALRQRVPAPVLADERLLAAAGDVSPQG
jgi:uncharacterized protein